MKKILFLLTMLLMGGVSSWAEVTYPSNHTPFTIQNPETAGADGRGYLVEYTDGTNQLTLVGMKTAYNNFYKDGYPTSIDATNIHKEWAFYTSAKTGKHYLYNTFNGKFLTHTANKIGSSNYGTIFSESAKEIELVEVTASGNNYLQIRDVELGGTANYLNLAPYWGHDFGYYGCWDGASDGSTKLLLNSTSGSVSEDIKTAVETAVAAVEGPADPSTWDHTDLVDGKTVRFRSYYENTKFLGTKSDKTGLETTDGQTTTFVIVESGEASGQYYLYDAANDVFVGKTQASGSANVPVTATASEAGLFQFVEGTATGKDDTKPRVAIMCMNPLNSGHIMLHHAQGTEAINYGGSNTAGYGGNGWQVVSLVDAAESDYQAAYDKLHPAGPDWTAFETKFNQLKAYTVGEGLGKYSCSMDETEVTESSFNNYISFFETTLSGKVEDVYEYCVGAMDEALASMTLNMPKAGQLLRIKDNEGNYMTCKNASNKSVFKAEKDVESIYLFTGNELIAYNNGFYASRAGSNGGYPCGMAQVTNPGQAGVTYHFHPSTLAGSKGKYFVTFGGDTRYMYQGANAGTNPNAAGYEFTLEEVTELPVAFHAGGKGYATLYSPVALDVAEGVKAYTVGNSEKEGVLRVTEVSVIPANTGVILEGTVGETVDFTVSEEEGSGESVLTGTFAAINKVDGSYVFSVVSENPGFYKYEGAALAGFKAYYVPTTTSEVQGFVLDFGGEQTTGIISVNENANANVNCFDLAGRRVNANVKGISIMSGKKIIK